MAIKAINWKTTFDRLARIESRDQSVVERGRLLIALLLCLIVIELLYSLAALTLWPWGPLAVALMLLLVILPTYVAARKGYVSAATRYFILCFSLVVFSAAIAGALNHDDLAVLIDCMTSLNFTIIVAALLIRPRSALTTLLLNCVLISGMYLIWRSRVEAAQTVASFMTAYISPILLQSLSALACFILTADREYAYRRLNDTMRESTQHTKLLRNILEQLPIGIALYDGNTLEPTLYNPKIVELIGVPGRREQAEMQRTPYTIEEQEVSGANHTPGRPGEMPWETVARTRTAFEPAAGVEIVRSDGALLSLEEKAVPIFDDQRENLLYVLYVALNVTPYRDLQRRIEHPFRELRTAYMNLRELDQLKAEFMASMSHELRTPLNSIIGYTDLILNDRTEPPSERRAKDIRAIAKASYHLRDLINDTLDLAKIDARHMTLELQPLDLREPVQEAFEAVKILGKDKPLTVNCTLPESAVTVRAEATRIKQVTYNLLSNAIKFTARGQIHLRMVVKDHEVRVSVQDTVPGIPFEQQELIFERFYQLGDQMTSRRSGTGLGLTISRSLIALHGGKLWVQSEPGRGSTFIFSIPLAENGT